MTSKEFIKYVKLKQDKDEFKAFKKDEWTNILDFIKQYNVSLKNYSDMGAWPNLIDNFVIWARDDKEAQALFE